MNLTPNSAFAGVDVAALRAFASAAVERFERGRQVGDDVLHVHFHAMHARPATRAVPLERIIDIPRPDLFHHQAHGAWLRPLRRMTVVTWQEHDLALLHR